MNLESELRAAAANGFTTVCCLPDTDPVIDTPAVVELVSQRANGVKGARVKCIGAITQRLEGKILAEMSALKEIGCVAVSNANAPIVDSSVLLHALEYATTLDLLVFLQAKDPWLNSLGVMHEGAASIRQGLTGIPSASELIGLARDLELVKTSRARAHFRTLSTEGAATRIEASKQEGLNVSCDVGINHLQLCDQDVRNFSGLHRIDPPLRSSADKLGLQRALLEGQIDAISPHHEPHDHDAKNAPFASSEPGISGFDTFVPLGLELEKKGELSLAAFIRAASTNPAQILGLTGYGIRVGNPADICVIDPCKGWTVTAKAMNSLGKNTPFEGRAMKGIVTHTLVNGELVHEFQE